MIFPTAGYCLSVRYHSPIWFLLVVMSPRTKTNSGKNWVATGHWPLANHLQCWKPALWMNYAFTMVHSDAHFNWQIVQFAPYDAQWKMSTTQSVLLQIRKLRIFDHRLNSIITELVRVHLLPSTSPPNRRLPTIYYITTFSTYITTSTTATTTSTHTSS